MAIGPPHRLLPLDPRVDPAKQHQQPGQVTENLCLVPLHLHWLFASTGITGSECPIFHESLHRHPRITNSHDCTSRKRQDGWMPAHKSSDHYGFQCLFFCKASSILIVLHVWGCSIYPYWRLQLCKRLFLGVTLNYDEVLRTACTISAWSSNLSTFSRFAYIR